MASRLKNDGGAAPNPFPNGFDSRDWKSVAIKFDCPVNIMLTRGGELYAAVSSNVPSGVTLGHALWIKVIGPLDRRKPLKEQLGEIGSFMGGEGQTPDDMLPAAGKWNSKTDGAFIVRVELGDLLKNEQAALSAILSRDEKALREVCPASADAPPSYGYDLRVKRKSEVGEEK